MPSASTCWIQPQHLVLWPLLSLSLFLSLIYTLFLGDVIQFKCNSCTDDVCMSISAYLSNRHPHLVCPKLSSKYSSHPQTSSPTAFPIPVNCRCIIWAQNIGIILGYLLYLSLLVADSLHCTFRIHVESDHLHYSLSQSVVHPSSRLSR